MRRPSSSSRFALTVIAATGERFRDFAPYVAAVNNHGVVAFQAALQTGGTGVFTGSGGAIEAVADTSRGDARHFYSHPALDDREAVSVYCEVPSGQAVLRVVEGRRHAIAATGERFSRIGPLGPTVNERGVVAFRADTTSGHHGVFAADGDALVAIADTRRFSGFQGLPVVDRTGRVVFRADLPGGGHGIYAGCGGALDVVADTTGPFARLGAFPSASASGTVLFAAILTRGGAGLYAATEGRVRTVVETNRDFETFRGGLVNDAGAVVFYAAPRGGPLGIYAGPDPVRDRLASLRDALFGSTLVDFALNPVSMNEAGQVAIRVKLADERQLIVRADPRE
jgi:hypothetical protein